jgi:hypothetical protein
MPRTYTTRDISIGTKVSATQAARYREAAGDKMLSEWVREVLDAHVARAPFEQKLMAELWALRYVMVNGLPYTAPNPDAAADEIHKLIAEAEPKKADKGRALLKGTK